ncbi:MAG: hypothetical protein IPH68_13455, partial [Chitinophagaceae bacterium]|nr:hypothetical protein [Chitinophagaceae bacterium]
MKYFVPLMAAICCPLFVLCQDITGLWKGTMINEVSKQSLDYEIVISKEKGKITAYSHTWFVIDDKKYYGVKKLNVRIAKDGKIVLQDAKLLDNNYPIVPYKEVLQLNVLEPGQTGIRKLPSRTFVTNRTRHFKELTGTINIKKVSPFSKSDLLSYLQQNSMEIDLT